MDLLTQIKNRRSIRKYQDRQIPREVLEKIIEAGTYASNAGGGQRSMIVGIRNAKLVEQLGKMNLAHFDRGRLIGSRVSEEQPSVIDDPGIKNGFYGAPALCIVFAQKDFPFSVPDAFCCAETMLMEAFDLGISSCIVSRAEETLDNETGAAWMREWGVPENYIARCFVALGFCAGQYPKAKPRRENRGKIIE